MEPLTPSIVVGVTGAGENTDALRFAIAQARPLGHRLVLAHAIQPILPPPPPSVLITDSEFLEIGDRLVSEVREELASLPGADQVQVTTVVRHGTAGSVLGELSKDAAVVVLQHRDLSRLRRIVTGSTVASVAAHAHCPVVSVPAGRAPGASSEVVTVGVHEDGGPRPVLEAAFAAAAGNRSSLRIVHAWRLAPAYDGLVTDDGRWSADTRAAVTAAAEELGAKYPEVPVDVEVHHEYPADVLARAGEASDLLVVGRHDGLPGLPHRLGSLARAVIAHANVPVMVVPL